MSKRVYGSNPELNLSLVADNPYHGRMLIMGYTGNIAIQAYILEGRSEGSRNRLLVEDGGPVGTQVADPTQEVGDPELTIYDAMRQVHGTHIVSNGNQTDRVVRYIRSGKSFEDAMNAEATTYEPDKLHTPRLTGFIDTWIPNRAKERRPRFGIAITRKATNSDDTIRDFYTNFSTDIILEPGVGYAVHTYKGDPEAPQSFDEPPFPIPIAESAQDMIRLLLETVQSVNRVAVAVKAFGPDRHDQVGPITVNARRAANWK